MNLSKVIIYCLFITALTGFFLRETLAIPPNRSFMMERLAKSKKEIAKIRIFSEIQIFEDESGSKYKSIRELLTLEKDINGIRLMSQVFPTTGSNQNKAFLLRVWDQGRKAGQFWLPGKDTPETFNLSGLTSQLLFQDQPSLLKEYLGMRGFEIPTEKDLIVDNHFKRVKRCSEIDLLTEYRNKQKIPAPVKTPEEQASEAEELAQLDCEGLKAEQMAKISEARKARLEIESKLAKDKKESLAKKPKPLEELKLPPVPAGRFYKTEDFSLKPVRGRIAVVIPGRENKNYLWLDQMNFTPVKVQFKAMGAYNTDYVEVDFFDDGFYKGGFIYPRTLLIKLDGKSVARVILRKIDLNPVFKGDQPLLIDPNKGFSLENSPLSGSETNLLVKITEAIR